MPKDHDEHEKKPKHDGGVAVAEDEPPPTDPPPTDPPVDPDPPKGDPPPQD